MSVFDQIRDLMDQHFHLQSIGKNSPHFKNLTSMRSVFSRQDSYPEQKSLELFQNVFSLLQSQVIYETKSGTQEMWRWEQKLEYKTEGGDRKPADEKSLEKKIVKLFQDKSWVNQVPTASGLFHIRQGNLCHVDLVQRIEESFQDYNFFELKVLNTSPNTPFHAAIESIFYALLYIFARKNPERYIKYDSEVLKAKNIHIKVLAPDNYYKHFQNNCKTENYLWMQRYFTQGLKALLEQQSLFSQLDMDFQFVQFPTDFIWSHAQETPSEMVLLRAVHKIHPLVLV